MYEPSKSAKPSRHPTYYFEDGVVIFRVEDTLFNVHRYFLTRESEVFRGMFQVPPTTEGPEGTNDERPIFLPEVKVSEFESLMDFFYYATRRDLWWLSCGRSSSVKTMTVEDRLNEWIDLLSITDRYQFLGVRKNAITTIELLHGLLPVQKLLLGTKYDISTWRISALEELCQRKDAISFVEATNIGMENFTLLARAREIIRERHFRSQLITNVLGRDLTLPINKGNLKSISFGQPMSAFGPPATLPTGSNLVVGKADQLTSSETPYNLDLVKAVVREVFLSKKPS